MTSNGVEDLKKTLRIRESYQAKLRSLEISEAYNLYKHDVEGLEGLVGKLNWDCIEQGLITDSAEDDSDSEMMDDDY